MMYRMLLLALLLILVSVSDSNSQMLLLHAGTSNTAAPITGAIQQESLFYLLQETGSKILR